MSERNMYRVEVCRRFMTGSELADFTKKYESFLSPHRQAREVNDLDFQILEAYKKEKRTVSQLVKHFQTSVSRIQTGLLKASLAQI